MDELSPLMQELARHPIAFLGGLASGIFRLNLSDEPVKGWLDQRMGKSYADSSRPGGNSTNGNGSGPQPISIE